MATTAAEIEEWFDEGVKQGATHMIIVCDTFDHEDYPVYVKPEQECRKVAEEYNGKNMQRIMEVYSMKMDKKSQLRANRCFNYD